MTHSHPPLPVLLSALCFIATGPLSTLAVEDQPASDPEAVVVTIGDERLTRAQVDKILRLLPPRQRALYSNESRREQFAEFIVRSKLYTREARKRGLENRPEVQKVIRGFKEKLDKNLVKGLPIQDEEDREQILELFKESLLAREAAKELRRETPVSSQEVMDYIEEHANRFDMVRGRRLVVRSASSNRFFADNRSDDQGLSDQEARARVEELRREIQEGADFEVLAAKHSDDPLTSGMGGDTGIVRRGRSTRTLVTPPETDLLFSMAVGDLSPVVQTPMGFAILKLEEKRKMTLEEARPEVETRIRNRKMDAWYQRMRVQNKVRIDPSFYASGPPTVQAPPQP